MHDKLNLCHVASFKICVGTSKYSRHIFCFSTCHLRDNSESQRDETQTNQFWAEDASQVGQEGWENYGILLLGSLGGDACGLDVRKPYSLLRVGFWVSNIAKASRMLGLRFEV